jgi:hypothetical protein
VAASLSAPPLRTSAPSSAAQLEAEALQACKTAGHTQQRRAGQPVACSYCLRRVVVGPDVPASRTLPVGAGTLHRLLADILADGGEYRLDQLTRKANERRGLHQPPYTETNISARLRDLRGWGWPVRQRTVKGTGALYKLDG